MTPEQPLMHASEAPAVSAVSDAPAAPARHRWWLWLLAVAAVGLIVYFVMTKNGNAQSKSATAAKGKGGKDAAAHAVPVTAVAAKTKDVGVYLNGLGTVNPLATVTVKSRVDGQLVSVNFHDGQSVHAGDLLAEIDPRPFQVQLKQAEGVKRRTRRR